jgi:hypothetical protein
VRLLNDTFIEIVAAVAALSRVRIYQLAIWTFLAQMCTALCCCLTTVWF